jgi:hypothetical protein
MLKRTSGPRLALALLLLTALLLPGMATSYHTGIGGEQSNAGETIEDVAKEGCLCHNAAPDNTVQVILDHVPYAWEADTVYEMKLQLIGGPDVGGAWSSGFSMRVSLGTLGGDNVQNWQGDTGTLTHTEASANTPDRSWTITWTSPAAGSGPVEFWITGNSVNGDAIPGADDRWNQLTVALQESSGAEPSGTRTLFAGDGNVQAPVAEDHGVDLEHMGAELRAHWLGLLGFGAVLLVVAFAGLLLRYGFSTSYKGRSNQLRLRYRLNRRGDQ